MDQSPAPSETLLAECREAVNRLVSEEPVLGPEEQVFLVQHTFFFTQRQVEYLRARGRAVPENLAAQVARNYYYDGPIVHALLRESSPEYETRWQEWFGKIRRWTARVGFRKAWPSLEGDHEDLDFTAGDLDIDCFQALRDSLPSFNFACRLSTWAYSIFYRQASVWLKRRRTRAIPTVSLDAVAYPGAEEPGPSYGGILASADSPPDEQAHQQLRLHDVAQAVQGLAAAGLKWPTMLQAWRLHNLHGLTFDQVAQELGCSKAGAYRYAQAVIQVLRQLPEELADEITRT